MLNRFINLELSKNQQTIINITAGVLNMLVTTMISFVLSPYIVRTLAHFSQVRCYSGSE